MSISYRVWTNPDGTLRLEPEEGRCWRFWELYQAGDPRKITEHLTYCNPCREWIDRCEEIAAHITPPAVPELDDSSDHPAYQEVVQIWPLPRYQQIEAL